MNELLIFLQVGLLSFVVWEFVIAEQLPKKYSKLKPAHIRLVDTAIAVASVLTIYYLATN